MTSDDGTTRTEEAAQPIHPLLANRFSPRNFDPQPPSTDDLKSLFYAAAWAPSAFNGQPWRFIAGVDSDLSWTALLDCLSERNRQWARTAPVLVLNLAGVSQDGGAVRTALYDLGQAVGHLTVQAMERGLYVRQMAGFDVERAQTAFGVPADYIPVAVMAIGRRRLPMMPTPARDADPEPGPRERRPLRGTVFASQFGVPAPWLDQDDSVS
jgi:nitroreductase